MNTFEKFLELCNIEKQYKTEKGQAFLWYHCQATGEKAADIPLVLEYYKAAETEPPSVQELEKSFCNPRTYVVQAAEPHRFRIHQELDRSFKRLYDEPVFKSGLPLFTIHQTDSGAYLKNIEAPKPVAAKGLKDSVQGLLVPGISSNFAKNKDIFLAHRFEENELIEKLKELIEKHKYNWKEGKREDLGSISGDILLKIKNCGFFIAVMTKKNKLNSGKFTTSSWLIEEKGAALAFGHRPLIMVEEEVDRHYVGFLQSDDEMIFFNRSNFAAKIKEAIKKIENTYQKLADQNISKHSTKG